MTLLQVNVRKLKYYYMEDDGGSFLTSPVDPQIKAAIRKVNNVLTLNSQPYSGSSKVNLMFIV